MVQWRGINFSVILCGINCLGMDSDFDVAMMAEDARGTHVSVSWLVAAQTHDQETINIVAQKR